MSPSAPAPASQSPMRIACVALFAGVMTFQLGCGLASNLMHGLGIDMIPAEYEGFKESTVAEVTLTDSTSELPLVAVR